MKKLIVVMVVSVLVGCNTVRVEPLGDHALPAVRTTGGHPKVFLERAKVDKKFVELAELSMGVSGLELHEIASKFQLKAAQIGADAIILEEVDPEAEGRDRYLDGSRARATAIGFR